MPACDEHRQAVATAGCSPCRAGAGRRIGTWTRWWLRYRPIEGAQHQQWDAEVPDPGEQTVELRLVDERAGQARRVVGEADQGEGAERGCPVIVEVPRDPDLVRRGAGHGAAGRAW